MTKQQSHDLYQSITSSILNTVNTDSNSIIYTKTAAFTSATLKTSKQKQDSIEESENTIVDTLTKPLFIVEEQDIVQDAKLDLAQVNQTDNVSSSLTTTTTANTATSTSKTGILLLACRIIYLLFNKFARFYYISSF